MFDEAHRIRRYLLHGTTPRRCGRILSRGTSKTKRRRAQLGQNLLQRVLEFSRALLPLRRPFLERRQDDLFESRMDERHEFTRFRCWLPNVLQRDVDDRVARKRKASGDQLVEQDPARVDVAAFVHAFTATLLG